MKLSTLKHLASAIIISCLSSPVYSAIIDNDFFTTDTETMLDWLDLTATLGESNEIVASRIASGGDLHGWSIASTSQAQLFLTNLGYPLIRAYDSGPSIYIGVDLLGNTDIDDSLGRADGFWGWTADSVIQDGVILTVNLGGTKTHAWSGSPSSSFISMDGSSLENSAFTWRNKGVYLYRPSEVPVPAAVWLFGSGLIGLMGFARRKNQVITFTEEVK